VFLILFLKGGARAALKAEGAAQRNLLWRYCARLG